MDDVESRVAEHDTKIAILETILSERIPSSFSTEWGDSKAKINEMHAAVYGNGRETSVLSRLQVVEKRCTVLWWDSRRRAALWGGAAVLGGSVVSVVNWVVPLLSNALRG